MYQLLSGSKGLIFRIFISFLFLYSGISCSVEEKFTEIENSNVQVNASGLRSLNNPAVCLPEIYSASSSDYVVNNITDLRSLLISSNLQENSIIYLADNAVFNLSTGGPIEVLKSVKIVSGRNEDNLNGAELHSNVSGQNLFVIKADSVTLSGLKIKGNDNGTGGTTTVTSGIYCKDQDGLRVENCEISGWSYAAIALVNSKNNIIVTNHIHHNRRAGLGYGISIHNINDIETDALISCNFFEYNRHDIAGSGGVNQSYEASYNFVGEPGILTHRFDMHGANNDSSPVAGTSVKIHHNEFSSDADLAIMIRGIPLQGAQIHDNTFKHKCEIQAIEQRKFDILINRENWELMNVYDNNYTESPISFIDFNNYFLFKNTSNDIMKYEFGSECSCNNGSAEVANGFANYREFLVGNWTGDGNDDMIAVSNDGDMVLFPFKNGTFYGQGGPVYVGNGFNNYREFLVGNWTGDGTDDLIAVSNDGDMVFFPFNNGTFYGQGGPVYVGNGFNNYKEFLVGNWTGDGTDDLIAMDNSGEMVFFPFNNGTFYGQGGPVYLGSGFTNYKKFFIGNWTGDGTDDLIALSNTDNMVLFPFLSNSFSTPTTVGTGFGNFKDYIVCNLPNRANDDIIAINKSNQLYLYYLTNTPPVSVRHVGCIKDYNLILNGNWISIP